MREYFFLSGSNLTMFLLSIYSPTVWWVCDKSNQRTEQMLASQNGFSALQIWESLLNFVISIYPENWVRIMFGIVFYLNTSHEQLSDQERYYDHVNLFFLVWVWIFYLSHECFSGLLEQPGIASAPDTFWMVLIFLPFFFCLIYYLILLFCKSLLLFLDRILLLIFYTTVILGVR